MRNLKKALTYILQSATVCIACHENPDGDAIGSLVALGMGLRKMGKETFLLSPDGVPEHLAFLTDSFEVSVIPPAKEFQLLILVDADSPKRLGKIQPPKHESLLIIDHHPPSHSNGIKLIKEDASSTAEIIYKVLRKLGVEFDRLIVNSLLTGIISDTGGLRFPNTSSQTLKIVSQLIDMGGDLSDIYRRLYEEKSEGYLKVLGEVLLRARTTYNGKVLFSYIKSDDLKKYGIEDKDLEGIVDYLRLLKGWEVIFLLRELADGVKVSIRARSLDAGKFAGIFGGGGHKEAAGCRLPLPLEEAEKKLREELRKWMEF
ncbi:MAG: DHH family phosphoesterase [bacterium]